jgi:hypothetical protein
MKISWKLIAKNYRAAAVYWIGEWRSVCKDNERFVEQIHVLKKRIEHLESMTSQRSGVRIRAISVQN